MRNGFTLVEMLVALFVFALVSAGGVAMLRFSVDNQSVVRSHSERTAQLQTARAILKADVSQAIEIGEGGLFSLVRRGWENPDGEARPSVQRVTYRLSEGRLERLAGPALVGAAMGPPQVLVEGVQSAAFENNTDESNTIRLVLEIEGIGRVDQLFPGAGG